MACSVAYAAKASGARRVKDIAAVCRAEIAGPVAAVAGYADGRDLLDGPPTLSADVRTLMAAVTAKTTLYIYAETITAYSAPGHELAPLLAVHRAQPRQLAAHTRGKWN
jgi:hypothetical protein